MRQMAVWIFDHWRALALSVAMFAAFWITYGYAQNGRYTLHVIAPILTDRETGQTMDARLLVLDTRTGDVIERRGSFRIVTRVSGQTEARWTWFVSHLAQSHPAPTPKSFTPDPRK